MCGRFTLTWSDYAKLARELEVEPDVSQARHHRARYNVAPNQEHWIVQTGDHGRLLSRARWGLVHSWAKEGEREARQINARSETAARSPTFREAFGARRCLVPADGFYEWGRSGQGRAPVWFHGEAGALLLFAGLYEVCHDPRSEGRSLTFTILTTAANAVVESIHPRMPVVLAPEDASRWLEAADGADLRALIGLMRPAPDDVLTARPVSRLVNSVGNEGPELLEPAGPPAQGSLPL